MADTFSIIEHSADCFEIVGRSFIRGVDNAPRLYSVGVYRTRRDAEAELRLVREAA
jgi:hypothetical protein